MTRADRIVLVCLLAVQPWLYAHFWGTHGAADTAVIVAAGRPPQQTDLRHDRLLHVPGPLGENTLEIKDGRIRFIASPCRGKQCIHSGWLARAGDFAACLPNRVTVTLVSAAERYDGINY